MLHNNSAGHISFILESFSYQSTFSKSVENNSIYLLQQSNNFNILEYAPKFFEITTNNGSYHFNTDILIDTSVTIKNYILENPGILKFHLNIDDRTNTLRKFELLYEGKTVTFEDEEFPILRKILNLLKIEKFPIDPFKNHGQNDFLIDFGGIPVNNSSIMISIPDFNHYLVTTAPQNFVIETDNRSYNCNIFGILSSEVLRNFIFENPNSDHYNFSYDENGNDFQFVCDIFNFKSIKITNVNIDILSDIAEKLKINIILNDIQKYINDNEKMNEKMDEQQEIIDTINEMFDWLYNIKSLSVNKVKNLIIKSFWIQTKDNVKELAAFINQVINSGFQLQKELFNLLIELNKEANYSNKLNILMPSIIEILMNNFASTICNCSFVYILQKNGLIKKDEITKKISLITDTYENSYYFYHNKRRIRLENILLWFLPEVLEIKPNFSICISYNEFNTYCEFLKQLIQSDKIDIYNKIRDNGEPDDEITKIIRSDDVDSLQKLVASNLESISKYNIPFNIYENYVPNGKTNYINYAAAYGSINCFKYLLLNHIKIDKSTLNFAIYGRNFEIIKIVEQQLSNEYLTGDINYDEQIIVSITNHQNNLFEWIYEQKYLVENSQDNININLFVSISIANGNAYSLIELINQGYDFSNYPNFCYHLLQLSSRKGFYRLTKLLFQLMQVKLNFIKNDENRCTNTSFIIQFKTKEKESISQTNNYNSLTILNKYDISNINNILQHEINYNSKEMYDNFILQSAVYSGNLSIFKLYENLMTKIDIENTVIYAVNKNYDQIYNYFFDTIAKNGFEIRQTFVTKILSSSVMCEDNNNLFEYINKRFMDINPKFFDHYNLDYEILESACKYKNINAAKEVINFIQKHLTLQDCDPSYTNQDNKSFTSSFVEAFISGSREICEYFINQKINISYTKICASACRFKSIDINILQLLIRNVSSYHRRELIANFILPSIKIKNKDAIDYLLKNGAPMENTLIEAVNTRDIDIVNIVLKYNSKPLFVNKVSSNKTALHIAVENKDIDNIKRLLSIPGINVNKTDKNGYSPFMIAFNRHDIEIVQIFLSNKNIEISDKYILIDTIRMKNIELAKLLINCPQIDINIQRDDDEQTALIEAVNAQLNDVVDLLVNNEKFDPEESRLNFAFFISFGDTPNHLINAKSLDVNYVHYDFKNPISFETTLTNSIYLKRTEKIDLIINHPSFDKEKSEFSTALFNSLQNGHEIIFKKLLKLANKHDEVINLFPLIFTCSRINPSQILSDILEHNEKNGNFIDFNQLLPNKKSFFTFIQIMNYVDIQKIIRSFLQNGANPNTPDQYGVYPLQYAIEFDSYEYVEELINSNKIDFNIKIEIEIKEKRKNEKQNMMFFDFTHSNKTIKFQKTDAKYKSYLHLAARSNNSRILALFLDKKLIDVNITDDVEETPLMEACRYGKTKNIKLLSEINDIDYLHCNNKGQDALKIVSETNDIDIKDKDEYFRKLILFANQNIQ